MKSLPVLKGSWLLGGVLEFAKDPIHFVTDNLQKYNGTFIADFKFAKLLITDQPEHILHVLQKNNRNYVKSPGYTKLSWALGKGLLTNEGESWLKQRRLIQPAFHRQKLEKIFLGMVEQTDHYCTQLQQYKHSGQELDITREMMALTSQIAMSSLFGDSLDKQKIQTLYTAISYSQSYLTDHIWRPMRSLIYFVNGRHRLFKKYMHQADQLMYDVFEKRRTNPIERDDLLALLMNTIDEETGERMNNKQLRDETATLFVAGHETSANALSWAFYLLAQHPQAYAKAKQEAQSVLADGHAMTSDDLRRLPYCAAVINESMRLYPPAWSMGRQALADDNFGEFTIKKNTVVFIPVYQLHRHPKFWKNPDDFVPERFIPDIPAEVPKGVFIPFGAGPRLCIGNSFAMMEMQMVLAKILNQFDITLANTQPVVPEPLITLRPKTPIQIRLS